MQRWLSESPGDYSVGKGVGSRIGKDTPKNLLPVADKPLIVHTLEVFQASDVIDAVVLVIHRDYANDYKAIVDQYGLTK